MGIYSRLKNIIKGKANTALDKVENPIELLDNSIREKKEAVKEAKRKAAFFVGSVNTQKRKLNEITQLATQYRQAAINCAKKEDQEGFAKWQKLEQETLADVEANKKTVSTIEAQSAIMTKKIKKLDEEISKLESGKANMAARLSTAEAVGAVNEILTGVDKSSSVSLEDLERKIEEKENYANGLENFNDNTEEELAKALADAPSENIALDMEKYKNM